MPSSAIKTVSVVIPSYNHQQYVKQAIESVLDQDWPKIDLIVIDDGSKDKSLDVIENIHKNRGGFQFISRENRGLIHTLNEGVKLAKGDFLCILASDDYLPPKSLSSRANFLAENPEYPTVFGDGKVVMGSDETDESMIDERRRQLFSISDPIPEIILGTNIPIHTLMVKKEILLSVGGFDPRYKYCEDLDIQLLLFLAGKTAFIDAPVYFYRTHGKNISTTNRSVVRADKVLCYQKFLEEVPALAPYRRLIRYRLQRQYLQLGRCIRDSYCGTPREREIFKNAWKYAWRDMRLFWYLLYIHFSQPSE